MTKLTKKEKFAMLKVIPAVAENPILVEFIDHEIDLLTKKNAGDKKPTANQVANESIKAEILAEMEFNKLYTCSDIVKTVGVCNGFTIQKVSPLMNQLAEAGKVIKTTDKRKTYFSLA